MRKSIRSKLFWAFLATTLLVVSGMYAFMRWSLDRGFRDFVNARQQERITRLIEALGDQYAEHDGWDMLAGDKRRWMQLLWDSDPRHRHPPRRLIKQALREPCDYWPPTLSEDQLERRYIPLELRVMLLRSDRSIIFGRADERDKLMLEPIRYRDEIIGYLGLLPGKPVNQPGELRFIERQTQSFVWIALLMVLLSALLAFLLAYALGRPLKRIAEATQALAVGRYDIRLPVESSDELGRLSRDVNELAAALERSEQARRRWVADISHELRTPLAVLHGELEALQDGIRPLTQEAIDSLLGDVMRLNRLTEDLYQLALSDQGALSYRKESVDPVAILREDIAALMPEFAGKQLRIEFLNRLSKSLRIHADSDRLSQLFRNLLTNSVKYTDVGGKLDIAISLDRNQLVIDFSDSAPAVPESEIPYLFDRFYRVESSRSRHHGGAGLGLAICANIVQAHQGTVSAEASPIGGLTVRIFLPLAS
ncbi:MAG: ATP-binding protein [Methylomicrobium sp.]